MAGLFNYYYLIYLDFRLNLLFHHSAPNPLNSILSEISLAIRGKLRDQKIPGVLCHGRNFSHGEKLKEMAGKRSSSRINICRLV